MLTVVVVVVVVGLVAVAATIWNLISVAGHKATLVEVVVVLLYTCSRDAGWLGWYDNLCDRLIKLEILNAHLMINCLNLTTRLDWLVAATVWCVVFIFPPQNVGVPNTTQVQTTFLSLMLLTSSALIFPVVCKMAKLRFALKPPVIQEQLNYRRHLILNKMSILLPFVFITCMLTII
ncbi:hypothetical protein T4A_3282 [Trichinella pseudospiralis]|uniref:Uncharacterized protein n=1 Tax=Trichinella pseudospiralis TaxID=6337 RepID=A0A0V1EJP6_TRIPS|nr:hypothetical protein T4A_3282 [Trichinella pseudospiralis]